jgi:two-component system chemotaxis response regulator CheY
MPKTILTVDDSATIRQSVKLTLAARGYAVREASSGAQALQLCAAEPVDLVLTDLNMPEMDGIEFIRRVRALPALRFKPIVMLSTESQADKKADGRAAGATGWIVKPFTPEQLAALVQKLCPVG